MRIAAILSGGASVGDTVTIRGWIRTRRDSKAGLSFLNVHDGSAFDGIQVVAPADLANYEDTVLHLTTGCSVECEGTVVESQGKGQSVEIQGNARSKSSGTVEDPDTYPVASNKRHSFEYLREVAHLRTRTNTFGASRACSSLASSQSVHNGTWTSVDYLLGPHADHHRQSDCEGAGETVPCVHARLDAIIPKRRRRLALISTDRTSSARNRIPDRIGAAQRRDLLRARSRNGCTRSGRRSERRTRTPRVIWQSSG